MTVSENTIKAIVQNKAGDTSVLEEKDIPRPSPSARDILVKIKVVGVNPIDVKKRNSDPTHPDFVLGWDGAGVVEAVGSEASLFKVGDEVMFAGDLFRNGTYAEHAVVDERIVGKKPRNLSWGDAGAFPLVSLTAWEALVEQAGLQEGDPENAKKSLLIINGAGGVGSVAIQLATKILKIGRVVATASRPETIEWTKKLGATDVINHRNDLKAELEKIGLPSVGYVLVAHADQVSLYETIGDILKPFGKIVSIIPTTEPLPLQNLFYKSATFSWTLMYTKSINKVNLESQGDIITRVAKLVEDGTFTSVLTQSDKFTLENVRKSHKLLEGHKLHGKAVLIRE